MIKKNPMTIINRAKYVEIARKIRELPPEKHVSSYEWIELVQKLCDSDDPNLNLIGFRELDLLKSNRTAINK